MKKMRTYTFPFAIAYADTDAGGIVYHGRYIEIAERARMDVLRDVRFPTVVKLGVASLSVEQKFVKDGDICAILSGTAAYIGGDLRPKRIPDSVAMPFKE